MINYIYDELLNVGICYDLCGVIVDYINNKKDLHNKTLQNIYLRLQYTLCELLRINLIYYYMSWKIDRYESVTGEHIHTKFYSIVLVDLLNYNIYFTNNVQQINDGYIYPIFLFDQICRISNLEGSNYKVYKNLVDKFKKYNDIFDYLQFELHTLSDEEKRNNILESCYNNYDYFLNL